MSGTRNVQLKDKVHLLKHKTDEMSIHSTKGSARKSKHTPVKTSLNNPYVLQWNSLDAADMHFILESLEKAMKEIGFKKIETRRKKKPFLGKNQEKEQCQTHTTEHQGTEDAENVTAHGWTDMQVRSQLAIGINEVTRALEKNELLLVLVCKSAKPPMLTSHLIPLCASRAVLAGQVPRLSENLAPLLGLTSVLALGFKRDLSAFADVVNAIIPRIPSLDVPWMQHGAEQLLAVDPLSVESQTAELAELNPDESSPTHKRKRMENKLASSNTALQPLSIKQIIPNPNKRRKLPKTKKRISK